MSERTTPWTAPLVSPVEPPPSRWSMPTNGPIDDSDIVAVGADLEPGTLLAAYRNGLFPMPFDRRRIAWFSPDPRGIVPLDGLHVSRSLRKSVRRFDVAIDTRFTEVMRACADPKRPGGWINRSFVDAYTRLHELGWAHSFEILDESGELVGGLYGVRIGGLFAGESMFHRATDARRGHARPPRRLAERDLSGAPPTSSGRHRLTSLGAVDVPRAEYLELLADAV
ncbi:MAG: leucyl/phenylalanyl-tRNA--protein transferase [Ilumatobacteraceae bacterium]